MGASGELPAEREPQLDQVLTENADGNEHMIAISAALGTSPWTGC